MSEFLAILPPPGPMVANYDRTLSYASQPESIPQTFLEAMSIREEVFVKEQEVPLENEFDSDDSRSYHWVTYASIGSSSNAQSSSSSRDPMAKRGSTASRLAVGTIRLVPPPHPPHPVPGSAHQIDNSENVEKVPQAEDAPTAGATSSVNPRNEPYVKISRLAILKDFRKIGLGKLLFDNALQWASRNAESILPPPSATAREAARMEGAGNTQSDVKTAVLAEKWDGLVLVHAQKHLEKMYQKLGFERDEGMGEWTEEGIPHIGMWRRLKVKKNRD